MKSLEYRMTELERRLANIVRLGVVEAADYESARVRVRSGDLLTGWIPFLTRRAGLDRDWWAPEPGEQVVVFSPGGDPAMAVALPAVYRAAHPAPASDPDISLIAFGNGATVSHNRATGELIISVRGDVTVTADGDLTATVGGAATVTAANVIRLSAPAVSIDAGAGNPAQGTMTGNFSLIGDISVQGNITATGLITDSGGNTNHHSHP